MNITIVKAGGTTVGDPVAFNQVLELVKELRQKGRGVILVVSAITVTKKKRVLKTTDLLLRYANQLSSSALSNARGTHRAIEQLYQDRLPIHGNADHISALLQEISVEKRQGRRTESPEALRDRIAGYGEKLSATLVSDTLNLRGQKAEAVFTDARETALETDNGHDRARLVLPFHECHSQKLRDHLLALVHSGVIPVVTGFIGRHSATNRSTLLGRNGSDLTATALAALLKAHDVYLLTDVDGLRTADPSIVPESRRVPLLSYREAFLLAEGGSKFPPETSQPLYDEGSQTRLWIARASNQLPTLDHATCIDRQGNREHHGPIGIARSKSPVMLVTLTSSSLVLESGGLEQIGAAFREIDAPIDLVATNAISVSVTVPHDTPVECALESLGSRFTSKVHREVGTITIVYKPEDEDAKYKIFGALYEAKIRDLAISASGDSQASLTLIVKQEDQARALQALHAALF